MLWLRKAVAKGRPDLGGPWRTALASEGRVELFDDMGGIENLTATGINIRKKKLRPDRPLEAWHSPNGGNTKALAALNRMLPTGGAGPATLSRHPAAAVPAPTLEGFAALKLELGMAPKTARVVRLMLREFER